MTSLLVCFVKNNNHIWNINYDPVSAEKRPLPEEGQLRRFSVIIYGFKKNTLFFADGRKEYYVVLLSIHRLFARLLSLSLKPGNITVETWIWNTVL